MSYALASVALWAETRFYREHQHSLPTMQQIQHARSGASACTVATHLQHPPINEQNTLHHHLMKHNTQQEQMIFSLGSEIGIPYLVWHAEKQQWIKCESSDPIRDRNVPRPTYRTVLVHIPNKGTRSERIPIPPESPVVQSMEFLNNILRHHSREGLQLAVEDAESGEPVRIVSLRSLGEQQPAYIPTVHDHDTTAATQDELEDYHRRISESPEVSEDFPWIASAYWNDFMGGSTELWLPEQQQWVRADALEYPRCLPHGGKFLTMEREHGYGGHVRQADGSLHFDWFPVLYELVTERPCTISIQAGYIGKRHRFTVRGQIRPAESTTSSSTH